MREIACTTCGKPLTNRLDTWGDPGFELCLICYNTAQQEDAEEYAEYLEQSKAKECPACHELDLYSKEEAGYPGLFHCANCDTWFDTVTQHQWKSVAGIIRESIPYKAQAAGEQERVSASSDQSSQNQPE